MGKDIASVGVEAVNKIRRNFTFTELKGDPTMHADAQKYAEHLASKNIFESSTMGKYGTCITKSFKGTQYEAIADAFQGQDTHEKKSTYMNPDVRSMGFGMAKNEEFAHWILVCYFDTPGLNPFKGIQTKGAGMPIKSAK